MIHNLSFSSVYIELYSMEESEKPLANATAFTVYEKSLNNWFLVTNWHCITGKHPETKRPLNKNGLADPTIMKVYFHSKNNIGNWKI